MTRATYIGMAAPERPARRYPSSADRVAVAGHLRAMLPEAWRVEAHDTSLGVWLQPPGAEKAEAGMCVFSRVETGRDWQRREAVRLWAHCVAMAGVEACEVRPGAAGGEGR